MVTKPFVAFFEAITVLFAFFCNVCDAILIDAERTDDGAVDSSEKQGHNDNANEHNNARSKYRRHKLQFRHPSEPSMEKTWKIQKKQGNQQKADSR